MLAVKKTCFPGFLMVKLFLEPIKTPTSPLRQVTAVPWPCIAGCPPAAVPRCAARPRPPQEPRRGSGA